MNDNSWGRFIFQTEQEAAEGRGKETEGTQEAGAATREREEEARRAESQEPGKMSEKSQGTPPPFTLTCMPISGQDSFRFSKWHAMI